MLKAFFGRLFGRRPAPPATARAAAAPVASPAPATLTQDDPGYRKLNREWRSVSVPIGTYQEYRGFKGL